MTNFGPPDPPEDYGSYCCELCGAHVDDCACPECPVCKITGNPECYALTPEGHGMKYSTAQLEVRAASQAREREQAEADRAEGDYWREHHLDELRDELHEKGHE